MTASSNTVTGGDRRAVWFGLLGSFELRCDGRTVLVTSDRLREIIAVLASSAGQTVSLGATCGSATSTVPRTMPPRR